MALAVAFFLFFVLCLKLVIYLLFFLGVVDQSKDAYQKALDLSEKKMSATHPIRLGLALNFSVFHYEIEGNPELACTLAKKVYTV